MGITWNEWLADGSWFAGSTGDYSRMVDLVDEHNAGLASEELIARIVSMGLTRHPLGCTYLAQPSPLPPLGVPFDARVMPHDWEGTVGELFMIRGLIPTRLWERAHEALHSSLSFCS